MNGPPALLTVVAVLLLVGCPPAREPLPSGLPPEYEAPRSYDPGKNIDGAGDQEGDEIVDAPPPATAPPAAPVPAPAADPAEDAQGDDEATAPPVSDDDA